MYCDIGREWWFSPRNEVSSADVSVSILSGLSLLLPFDLARSLSRPLIFSSFRLYHGAPALSLPSDLRPAVEAHTIYIDRGGKGTRDWITGGISK